MSKQDDNLFKEIITFSWNAECQLPVELEGITVYQCLNQ